MALGALGRQSARGDQRREGMAEELFYDIVEALHDVVARPRKRTWHDYAREWDYFDFARTPGQAI
jgi:hypothetical protein